MFRNEYTLNRKLIKEYVFAILCKDIIIIGTIISLLLIIVFALNSKLYMGLICMCFIVFFIAFTPSLMIKNLEDNSKRLNNGKIEKTIVDFNKNIVMNEGKVHLEFEYSQVKKIKQTKNFIVLLIGPKSAILVYKNGFTNGTTSDFINFINEKIKKNPSCEG